MIFPDPFGLGTPARPTGDAGAIRVAAGRLAGAADQLRRIAAGAGAAVHKARSEWTGDASDAFTDLGRRLQAAIDTDAAVINAAAGALTAYAAHLEAAQSSWATANVRAQDLVGLGPLATDVEFRPFARQATDAEYEASMAAQQLAGELETLRGSPRLPNGPSPMDIRAMGHSIGLSAGLADGDGRVDSRAFAEVLKQSFLAPMSLLTGALGARTGFEANQALGGFWAAAMMYRDSVLAHAAEHGPGPSHAAFAVRQRWLDDLTSWMSRDRAALAAYYVEEAHRTRDLSILVTEANKLGKIAAGAHGLRVAGDLLGPFGMVFDVQTVFGESKYDGAREFADRGVGVLGFGAGAVGVAGLLGIAVAPPVAIAAGVVGAGAAIWGIGNFVYDHRKEIAIGVFEQQRMYQRWALTAGDGAAVQLDNQGVNLERGGTGIRDAGVAAERGLEVLGTLVNEQYEATAQRLESSARMLRDLSSLDPATATAFSGAAVTIEGAGTAAEGLGRGAAATAGSGGDLVQGAMDQIGEAGQVGGRMMQRAGDEVRNGVAEARRWLGLP